MGGFSIKWGSLSGCGKAKKKRLHRHLRLGGGEGEWWGPTIKEGV